MHKALIFGLLTTLAATGTLLAEPIAGNRLAVRSTGGAEHAHGWRLDTNGYVGTYISVDQPGEIGVIVGAYGLSDHGEGPQMLVSMGDQHRLFTVTKGDLPFETSFDLMPGTHFIRIAFANDDPDREDALVVHQLRISGATILNEHTDTLALAAADTWIEHGRRGTFSIHLPGVEPGTQVRAKLTRLGFNLGANIPGTQNIYITDNPEPGSMPEKFQKHFLQCFNATVPSNAGKWAYNEAERDVVTMDYVDAIIDYAREHGLWMRMHTLIWNTGQQPDWVRDWVDAALEGNAEAKTQLREEISERIAYYVRDRAHRFNAIDVLNEAHHQPAYLQIFGIDGVAEIYRETAEAIRAADSDAQTFINEYNILQWSSRPPYGDEDDGDHEPDPYANWYREHAEELMRRDAQLGGIGVQYYADARQDIDENVHSPARIAQVLHNLSLTGLPISLTEFGVSRGATPQRAAQILSDTMRLVFGHPSGQTFLMFGFYRGATWDRAAEGTLFNEDWSLSEPGKAYFALLEQWSTDETLTVDEKNTVTFKGYYGDYEITVGDRVYPLTLDERQSHYEIMPEPVDISSNE